jgi:hypothetical protein
LSADDARFVFTTTVSAVLLVAAATVSAVQQTAPSRVLELMYSTLVPASDVIFSAQAEPPKTPEGWTGVEKAAQTLAEAAHQLTTAPLARAEPEWTEIARELEASSLRVEAAAAKRDEARLLEEGDNVYATCDTCHKRFLKGRR